MMVRLGLIVLVALAVAGVSAKDEFGPCADVRIQHPEFFKPGAVIETVLGSEPWYVYCGDAEKCFSEGTDSELYQEAEIQAKSNFYEHFVKKEKNKGVKVEVSHARRMYQVADGAMRYVVMGVPKSGVKVMVPPSSPAAVNKVEGEVSTASGERENQPVTPNQDVKGTAAKPDSEALPPVAVSVTPAESDKKASPRK